MPMTSSTFVPVKALLRSRIGHLNWQGTNWQVRSSVVAAEVDARSPYKVAAAFLSLMVTEFRPG